MLSLARALRVAPSTSVALVGAGGKTTAMFQLARELGRALITTTTHLGGWQLTPDALGGAESRVLVVPAADSLADIDPQLAAGVTAIVGPLESGTDRYQGLTSGQLGALHELAGRHELALLIEADGARGLTLKAPAEHEPAIPSFVDQVVVVAGMSVFRNPSDWEQIHRPELFAGLAGIRIGEPVTLEALARVLTGTAGGLKGIPDGSRRTALLNQADSPELQSMGSQLAALLLPVYDAAVVARLASRAVFAAHERIAGIVLAAGESRRFGQPKQLLEYEGRPFVRAVTENALAAGLGPVIVVSGSGAEAVEAAVRDLPVLIARNDDWGAGQASSIRAGLSALLAPGNGPSRERACGGAIFLLADMPQVTVELLRALVEFHARELPAVAAPLVEDRRANPVLFDRLTFPELMKLEGDVGGRAVFSRYPPAYMTWLDEGLLRDVDTPEDYAKLLKHE